MDGTSSSIRVYPEEKTKTCSPFNQAVAWSQAQDEKLGGKESSIMSTESVKLE